MNDSVLQSPIQQDAKPRNLVIVVHGVGDQSRNATVQSAVERFAHAFGAPQMYVALGQFYVPFPGVKVFKFDQAVLDATGGSARALANYDFAEFYWADVPREYMADGHILEAPAKWGRAVADRIARSSDDAGVRISESAHRTAAEMLEELVVTLDTIDRLLFLANKAGIGDFSLNEQINTFFDCVQTFTEYEDAREKILARFNNNLSDLLDKYKAENGSTSPPNIYFVAHSEGSAITLVALLRALNNSAQCGWIANVKGLMTIGSPIDKHRLLWHSMWKGVEQPSANASHEKIRWINFYDYGDPIGFCVQITKRWMQKAKWDTFWDIEDIGFDRYYLPGLAHNGYWSDDEVFQYFKANVIDAGSDPETVSVPKSEPASMAVSYLVPYVLITAILFLASYQLITNLGSPENRMVTSDLQNSLALTLFIMAALAPARILVLSRGALSWTEAVLALIVFGSLHAATMSHETAALLPFEPTAIYPSAFVCFGFCVWAGTRKRDKQAPKSKASPITKGTRLVLLFAIYLYLLSLTLWWISNGMQIPNFSLSKVVFASAAFFYLLNLCVCIFDLVFVWHRYIRKDISKTWDTKRAQGPVIATAHS